MGKDNIVYYDGVVQCELLRAESYGPGRIVYEVRVIEYPPEYSDSLCENVAPGETFSAPQQVFTTQRSSLHE